MDRVPAWVRQTWQYKSIDCQPYSCGNLPGLFQSDICKLILARPYLVDSIGVPGIRVVAMPGHTPGQVAPIIRSNGEQLMYTSDALIQPLHVEHPEWYCTANIANKPAVASARRFLGIAASEKALVHGCHFPWPGLGYVVRRGDGWQWQPVEP
jgi:glyoxylase-like metal-dependent hydrolase (beta-lactamase superfamily II)